MAQIHIVGLKNGRFDNLGGSANDGGLTVMGAGATDPGFEIQNAGSGDALKITNTGAGYGLTVSAGNVGLGTTSPASQLHVVGDLTVSGALGLYTVIAGETVAQYQVVYAYYDSDDGVGRIKKALATAESTSRVIGAVVSGNTAGNAATVVMAGVYSMIFVDGSGTSYTTLISDFGKPVYLSQATAGTVTLVGPTTRTQVSLRVGYLVGAGATAAVSIHIGDPTVL